MPCAGGSYQLPPTMIEHLQNDDRPTEYYYFWSFGGLCLLITCFILFPRIKQFHHHAIQIRDERNKALMPFSYIACLLLVSFPLVASFLKYIIFISPISAHTIDFVIKSYEGLVLFVFTRLLIMFLGATNTINALQGAEKTKFWTVPPFGCCLRKCCKASTVTKKDFRTLHTLIIQYSLSVPLLTFMIMLRTYEQSKWILWVLRWLELGSGMLAFYGLLALLRASNSILYEYKMKGKFWCIKGIIVVMIVPNVFIDLMNSLPGQNHIYDKEVMVEAYGAIIAIFCFTLLSFVFLIFFKPEDALYAMHNAEKKNYKASQSLVNLKKERVRIKNGDYDNVIQNTKQESDENEENIELQQNKTI